MNQTNTQPPKLDKKKTISDKTLRIGFIVLLSGTCGFAGSMLANTMHESQGINIQQNNSEFKGKIETIDVSNVVKQCLPTVVEIRTETATSGNNPFQQYVSQGAGSGVIISENGYIVTNHHVIDQATSIQVITTNGKTYKGTLIGSDAQTDLAIVKIEASELPFATVGNSTKIEVGDTAIAIGNPLGSLGGTVTTGIISALNREITIEGETMTLLQTDAAINPGNSGGGLFDQSGNLIGIVNAKQSAAGIEGLGFAIPISDALPILDDLAQHGHVTNRPALNLSLADYTANDFFDVKSGVYIVQIVPGGAADEAGLKQSDRIVTFDGEDITASSEVKDIIRKHNVGDTLDIVIERNGKQIEKTVTLKEAGL